MEMISGVHMTLQGFRNTVSIVIQTSSKLVPGGLIYNKPAYMNDW